MTEDKKSKCTKCKEKKDVNQFLYKSEGEDLISPLCVDCWDSVIEENKKKRLNLYFINVTCFEHTHFLVHCKNEERLDFWIGLVIDILGIDMNSFTSHVISKRLLGTSLMKEEGIERVGYNICLTE